MSFASDRGFQDCSLDRCENAPFSSVGGLDKRDSMETPYYVSEEDIKGYLDGYVRCAKELYGDDWMTCEFGWKPAIIINDDSKLPGEADV